MISEDEARVLAQTYLDGRSNGFTFRFGPTEQKRLDDWTMVFDCIAADGSVLDGPIVVFVDKHTGRARTLEQAIKEHFPSA